MKKIITSVIALLALTGAMFAQTGERLILEKGKTYTFCVRGEENLVLAHYGEEPAFIVEPYEEGNPNQLMAVAYYVDDTEGYTNLYNVGTGYTWSDKGTAVPAAKGQDGEWIRETWQAWDLELDEDGYIRIVHFLERWGWAATYEPQYLGVIMMLSGDELAPLLYSRVSSPGVRDHSEYESYADQFFDFKVKEIGVLTGIKDANVDKIVATGGVGTIYLNNLNEGSSIIVCSIDGKQVKSLKATAGDCHFNMAEGLYIVNVDGKSFKVIVR